MAATKRLSKEIQEILNSKDPDVIAHIEDLQADEANILKWTCKIKPETPPYSGKFKIKIDFPAEYPFKPPKVTFETKIYHPNIDEKGQVCLPIISPENWKPATKVMQVIDSLVTLIKEPEPEHPLRADVAEEYTKNRNKFLKNAAQYTKDHASGTKK